jgi:hypothetical protein
VEMSYLVVRKYNYKTIPNNFYLAYHTTDFQDAVKKKNELEKYKEDNVDIRICSFADNMERK